MVAGCVLLSVMDDFLIGCRFLFSGPLSAREGARAFFPSSTQRVSRPQPKPSSCSEQARSVWDPDQLLARSHFIHVLVCVGNCSLVEATGLLALAGFQWLVAP